MNVYLDHNATTPFRPEVREILVAALAEERGNASSSHAAGSRARAMLDRARRTVAGVLDVNPDEIIFTGSGTESVITGVAGVCRAGGSPPGHVVLSAIEHAAGEHAGALLAREGWAVTRLAPDGEGRISPESLEGALRPETALVSVIHANNETGVIQPIEDLAALCRTRGIPLHTDAVQSAGKIPVAPGRLGVDLLSLAAHKFGGPEGVGALWIRRGIPFEPFLPGSQEGGRRGGTAAPALALGLAGALRLAEEARETSAPRLLSLRERLETRVLAEIEGVRVTGGGASRLPNTSHFTFPEEAGSDLVPALDLEGFAVSAGSACASGSTEPSRVLLAMGIPAGRARTAIRVGLGSGNRPEEIEAFVSVLVRVVARARGAGRVAS